jgi:putative phosphoesterase
VRIVVLGDIHANLAALEAALAEARRIGYDRIVHTGDLVGYGPQPNEVVERIVSLGIEGVGGDFDKDVAWAVGMAGCPPDAPGDAGLGAEASQWTRRRVSHQVREQLKDLPFSIELRAGEQTVSIAHGSPVDLYEALDGGTGEGRLREIAEETGATIHVSGHAHSAVHRTVDRRHFINAGSVGIPAEGKPEGCLAVIEADWIVAVSFRKFAYEGQSVLAAAAERGLPERLRALLASGL